MKQMISGEVVTKMDISSLVDEFEKRLSRELKPHMGTPVAVSGGIDSGVLAALAEPRFVISVDVPGGEKYSEIKYARKIASYLGLKHVIVKLDSKDFRSSVKKAVKAIGRPIPHFNIFPLYKMYEKLAEMGEKELILGDGPDETMMGYGRDLIFDYLYSVYSFAGFKGYQGLIEKVLPDSVASLSLVTGKSVSEIDQVIQKHKKEILKEPYKWISFVDIELMRPDMDDMSNKIAESFGIKNIRPYQDNPKFDKWQLDLPYEAKVKNTEWGKYLLRIVAAAHLPSEIALRLTKMGGPVYPVGLMWKQKDEFDKERWIKYQQKILAKS